MQCDMRNEEEIKAMFKWVEDHPDLGKVDICIPNAGMSYKSTLLEGMNGECFFLNIGDKTITNANTQKKNS